MVSNLDDNFCSKTNILGNICKRGKQNAPAIANIIKDVDLHRLGGKIPNYYVSDSAPLNKAAVRRFMGDDGDESWFLCCVHLSQLAMREATTYFLDRSSTDANELEECEWDELSVEDAVAGVENINRSSSFHWITSTCRAIRVAITKFHSYTELFHDYQKTMKVHTVIEADVRKRFDSTLLMLASVFKNRSVLQRIQEIGKRNSSLWHKSFHLSHDDFTNIENVVMILSPIQEVTRSLSKASAWIGDAVPLLKSAIDVVDKMDVAIVAMNMKSALICAFLNVCK